MDLFKPKEPEYYYSQINTPLLNYRVYYMPVAEKMMYILALFIAGGVLGMIFYGDLFKENGVATMMTNISNVVVFTVVGIIVVILIFPKLLNMFRKKREQKLKNQFRDFLSALATSMSSGSNLNDALAAAYEDVCSQHTEESFMAKEIKEMLEGIRNNINIEDSLENFGERTGNQDIMDFATVFRVSYRSGGNMKEIVKRSSDIIGQKMIINEEIDTKLTSNKIQLYVMYAVPVVMMLMLKGMSSDFKESFTKFFGLAAVTASIVILGISFIAGNKILDVKE